jgi:hypothetical protein
MFELEYEPFNAEKLTRIELRQQLIHITLTFAGVLIGVGVESRSMLISSILSTSGFLRCDALAAE